MSSHVLEWAPFTVRSGVEEAELMRSSKALQDEFLAKQPGFVRRQLVRNGERDYVDLVWWSSMDAAKAAMDKAAASPTCAVYFGLMGADHNSPGEGVRHYRVVGSY